jgi:hypothetical protein
LKELSKAISYLFHPLLMATYGTAIYLFLLPSPYQFSDERIPYFLIGLIATGTFLLPVFVSLMMLRMGRIRSLEMETIGERNWPLVSTAIIYFMVLYTIHTRMIPEFIQVFILGATSSLVLALIINFRWKISLHMIGAGGLCGGVAGSMIMNGAGPVKILAAVVILSGIIASARHALGSHTLGQILAGYIVGFGMMLTLMLTLL